MTRQEIETEYRVEHGIIQNPGKFEGEPLYVPYFWDAYLMGMADDDDGETLTFLIGNDDREQFPELEGIHKVYLWETDTGFVSSDTISWRGLEESQFEARLKNEGR